MTKREVRRSAQFRKDVRLAHKQGKDISLLDDVIVKLANDEPLSEKYQDHALSGNWKGHRECHISPDWLLVYKKTSDSNLFLFLIRTASHSDLRF